MNNLLLKKSNRSESIKFAAGLVQHQYFEEALYKINHTHCTHASEPAGLTILGDPGVGKSRLASEYKKHFDSKSISNVDTQTVLLVEMPPSTSIERFYTKVLSALGAPDPSKGKISFKEERVLELLAQQAVELLIIDEIHNLLRGDADGAQTHSIANTIKSLMNQSRVPIVLMGEKRAKALHLSHQAIRSRFQNTVVLENMRYLTDEDKIYFADYLSKLQEHITVPSVNLSADSLAPRMFAATGGNPREIRKIIVAAIDYIDESESQLDISNLAFGFQLAGVNPLSLSFNPFTTSSRNINKVLAR